MPALRAQPGSHRLDDHPRDHGERDRSTPDRGDRAPAARHRAGPADADQHRREHHEDARDVHDQRPPDRVSLPVPRPCSERDRPARVRGPVHRPPRAVADPLAEQARDDHATSRSNATAPRPSQIGRYEPTNGTNTSTMRIGAKLSATAVTMCTARNAVASSETLRCNAATTKRGQRGLAKRTTSVDAERDAHRQQHQADHAGAARRSTRAPCELTAANTRRSRSGPASRNVCTIAPSRRDEPGRQAARLEPRRRAGAHDDRGGARDVGVDARRRRDAHGAPVLAGRLARSPDRSRGAAHGRRARQRRTVVPEVARPPDAITMRWSAVAGARAAWSSVTSTGQPPASRRPGHREVAAEADEHAAPVASAIASRGPIGAQRLRGRAEVELDARAEPEPSIAARSISIACQPGTRCTDTRSGGPVRRSDREVAVVAEHAHRRVPTVGSTRPSVRRAARSATSSASMNSGDTTVPRPTRSRSPRRAPSRRGTGCTRDRSRRSPPATRHARRRSPRWSHRRDPRRARPSFRAPETSGMPASDYDAPEITTGGVYWYDGGGQRRRRRERRAGGIPVGARRDRCGRGRGSVAGEVAGEVADGPADDPGVTPVVGTTSRPPRLPAAEPVTVVFRPGCAHAASDGEHACGRNRADHEHAGHERDLAESGVAGTQRTTSGRSGGMSGSSSSASTKSLRAPFETIKNRAR